MLKRTVHLVINYLKKLNVYVVTNEDTVADRRKKIIATRLFFIFFIISLTGLTGYASLSLQLTTVRIDSPSQAIFEQLYGTYPDTLVCSCSQTSIQVKKFVTVDVLYHQVSSLFTSKYH